MNHTFDPYHQWLGISPKDQPPNHYRLLGIDLFESDANVISNAADQRMAHIRSFQAGKHSAESQKILNEISSARVCLLNSAKKVEYDAGLRAALQPEPRVQPLPDPFLQAAAVAEFPVAVEAPIWPVSRRKKKDNRGLLVAIAAAALLVFVGLVALFLSSSGTSIPTPNERTVAAKTKESAKTSPSVEPKVERPPQTGSVSTDICPPLAIAPFDANAAKLHQARWADYLHVPVVQTNSLGMKLVLIPPGEFTMGSPRALIEKEKQEHGSDKFYLDHLAGEGPAHRVRITKPFRLGMFEVTQDEYQRVMESNPSEFSVTGKGKDKIAGQDTRRFPVESVSWNDAAEFCRRLGRKEGMEYRLPTEAEWEYACRAGTVTKWSFGDDETDLGSYVWSGANSKGTTHPVGVKLPNPWGLFDMHGNAYEWSDDWYVKDYYAASPIDDPIGPSSGDARVVRGGSWGLAPYFNSRCASRGGITPVIRYSESGFRVVTTP
jgi:formylglycine-generating enzyme required for sulfatase activity